MINRDTIEKNLVAIRNNFERVEKYYKYFNGIPKTG